MARAVSGGVTRLRPCWPAEGGRGSGRRRPGVKKEGGQSGIPGNIRGRQRGTKFHPGANVGLGRDHTIFATAPGRVKFQRRAKGRTFVSVEPAG